MEDVLYDFDDFFRNTHKSIQRISKEYVTSNNLDERFSDSNIRILKTLDDINSLIYRDLNKLNLIVSESANDFISIVLIISFIGLLIGLFFWLFIRRLITRPVNELVLTSMDIAQGESDLTKRIAVKEKTNWENYQIGSMFFLKDLINWF